MSGFEIVLGVLAAIVVAGFAIWLVPQRQVARWRREGIADDEKLAELGLQARTGITQALGGLALIVTLALTGYQANQTQRSADATQRTAAANLRLAAENLSLTERAQIAERFSRAVEELGATNQDGSAAVDVRSGALFSLMRVGLDSTTTADPVFRVVAAYIGNNYKPPSPLAAHGCASAFTVRPDVQVALRFVLPAVARAELKHRNGLLAGLRGARLDGLALDDLTLSGLDLTGVRFHHASLVRADFRGSNLRGASLDLACLREADFRHADLRGAHLDGANLNGARLDKAILSERDLARAPLTDAQKHSATIIP